MNVSATSFYAGKRARRHATQDREIIYHALADSRSGLTDEEIERITGIDGNTVRPRRGELVTAGRVVWNEIVRPTKSGSLAKVWSVRL